MSASWCVDLGSIHLSSLTKDFEYSNYRSHALHSGIKGMWRVEYKIVVLIKMSGMGLDGVSM